MGLTIHYGLRTPASKVEDVRALVEALRQVAKELPFKEVGELLEFQGESADFERSDRSDENRWFKIQAGGRMKSGDRYYAIAPTHIIGFSAWPGEGCEPANFGLCQYPASSGVPRSPDRSRQPSTSLDDWRWRSFCKTQYASDPKWGGLPNFLRCHLCVIRMLDFAKSTGLIRVEVNDEGGYWGHRDLEKLGREVGDWNEMIAAISGAIKDSAADAGMVVESAIAGFPNFEHLEAKGLQRLEALRRSRG